MVSIIDYSTVSVNPFVAFSADYSEIGILVSFAVF